MNKTLQSYTQYLLNHRLKALVFVFVSVFFPIIGVIGVVFALLITLSRGAKEGALFIAIATLPHIIIFSLFDVSLWAFGCGLLINLLTYSFAVMLQRGTSWSDLLQIGVLIGVLAVSLIHLAFPDVGAWWAKQLQAPGPSADMFAKLLKAQPNAVDLQQQVINSSKQVATGIYAYGILAAALMQLVLARWWQVAMQRPKSLRHELHNIRLSHLAGYAMAGATIIMQQGNSVVADAMPLMYFLFTVAGLSLVHYMFALITHKSRWFWLVLFYFMLIFFVPNMLVSIKLLSLIAWLDIWIDFRKRMIKN